MTAVAVVAPVGRFRAAIAELPLSARLADDVAGAVVVLGGATGWVDAALEAAASGAIAILVADPAVVPADGLRLLADELRIPLIIERPLLRHDVAQAAAAGRQGAAARALSADAGAGAARMSAVRRDALGWLRVLAREPLAVVGGDRELTLLRTASGIPVTLSVAPSERPRGGWIRAEALGETRTDVRLEAADVRVTTSTRAGVLIAPTLFESSERLAVRRAIESLTAADLAPDLDDLRADAALAEAIDAADS